MVNVHRIHAIHRSVACGHMLSTLFFPPVPFLLQVSSNASNIHFIGY